MSSKTDLKTGAVFEVKLDDVQGFGYVKLLISHDIDSVSTFNLFIVKPYNVFSKISLKNSFDPRIFETDDIICFPQNMYFRPKLRGLDSWSYIGMANLTNEDLVIPDYIRMPFEYYGYEGLKKAIIDKVELQVLCGLKQPDKKIESYENIMHLGIWPHSGSSIINRFLSMYWMERHDKDFIEFYKKYETSVNYYEPVPFNYIAAGLDMMKRDNTGFQKMEKIKRLKYNH